MNGQWLALTKHDGRIVRKIPVVEDRDLKGFKQLMKEHTKVSMFDSHTWISVFNRPNRSRFTRVQRLSCCLSVLFLAMVTNAMWFGTENPASPSSSAVTIGPIRLTFQQFFVGLMSSLIVVPPNILIAFIFQRSRPRRNGISAAEVLKLMHSSSNTKAKKRRFMFPWWFLVFGYFLVFASVFVAGFFTLFYSLEWGAEKSTDWLLSLVLSFTQSIILVQPFKVRLLLCITLYYIALSCIVYLNSILCTRKRNAISISIFLFFFLFG